MLINGVEFFEDAAEPRSPEQQYANDNARTTRTLQRRTGDAIGISEVDRFNAAKALLGYAQVRSDFAGARYITRILPDAYPIPLDLATLGLNYLWATNIRRTSCEGQVKGVDAFGAARYACVRFVTEYNLVPYLVRVDDDVLAPAGPLMGLPDEGYALAQGWLTSSRWVSRQWKPGATMYSLPQGLMRRVDDKSPVKQAIPFNSIEGTIRYTWHAVPIDGIPENSIIQTENCVNDAEFDGRPRGTLMLRDLEMHQYQSALGIWMADITYIMGFQPNFDQVTGTFGGWNSRLMFDKTIGGFRYVQTSSDGNVPDTVPGVSNNAAYSYRDFTALFRPDQP